MVRRLLGVLAACLLAAPLAAAFQPGPQLVDATRERCAGARYEGRVVLVQAELNRIYADDAEFRKDVGAGANPLRDGRLGPITRKWLGVFCARNPFKAHAAAFDAEVAARLSAFGREVPPAAKTNAVDDGGKRAQGLLAGLETTYRYDPAVLRKPQDLEPVLARLALLTDRYDSKELFDQALGRALKGLALDPKTRSLIVTLSEVDGYLLPSAKVNALPNASPSLREKLLLKADIDYASADEFHFDLETAVGEGPERAELSRYQVLIDGFSLVKHYRIPSTLAADLAAASAIEPPLAALYRPMAKVEYPTRQLLEDALRARLERALGMCKANHYRQDGRIEADDDVKALWALVDGGVAAPGRKSYAEVAKLRAAEGRCNETQLGQAQRLTEAGHDVLYAKLDNAAELAKVNRAPPLAGQAGPGAVANCGCAHDEREGMTYGFYPLWTDSTQQHLDFDVLSRIGLYGMTIDDQGVLHFPAGVQTPPWALLKAAHRHMTKVDWVLYKNDWEAASAGGMAVFLDSLRQNIGRLLRRPYPRPDWSGTALASLGLEQGPSAGDGITLRFEGFPDAEQDQEALRSFVRMLAADLRAMKPARQLNFMVAQEEIVSAPIGDNKPPRPFSAAGLHELLQQANRIDDDAAPVSSRYRYEEDPTILVLLEEPTTRQKLELRTKVEQALFSNQRVRLLRNLVPVVEYDAGRDKMLTDDIIYFQNNFGGIGFWPLPFASAEDETDGSTTVNSALHAYFTSTDMEGDVKSELIDLICPNRAWLRWLAWIASIVAVAAGVTLARCRGCGTRLDNNKFYMAGMVALLVLPFIVIATLVVGDPLFKSDSGVHWFVAALLIGVVIVPGAYGLLKPARQLP